MSDYEQSFIINGIKHQFSLSDYLSNSLDINRKDMPQVDLEEFFKHIDLFEKHIKIMKLSLPIKLLKPIQNEIDMFKVWKKFDERQKGKLQETEDPIFICSNDFHIIDGHHTHVELLISKPLMTTTVYMFDFDATQLYNFFTNLKSFLKEYKDINDKVIKEEQFSEIERSIFERRLYEEFLNVDEDFGVQGPEAVPGIGKVSFGEPSNSVSSGQTGSGDIISGDGRVFVSKALLSTQHNFLTVDRLKEIASEIKKKNKTIDEKIEEGNEKNEIITDNHYEDLDAEFISSMKNCINKPVFKKYIEIENDFSCKTLEGIVQCKAGDILMRGVDGEIYPVDRTIFDETYQRIE